MGDVTINIEESKPLPQFDNEWRINVPYEFQGLIIVIEYLSGDVRNKVMSNGATISNTMPTAYGYILRTNDIHGEEIDMYLANMPDYTADALVIDQINPNDSVFDEHKVMLGFSSTDEAVQNYMEVFSDGSGSNRLGAITTFPGETFKEWVNTDGATLRPASQSSIENSIPIHYNPIKNNPNPNKPAPLPIDETGGVVLALPDLRDGPKLYTKCIETGVFEYTLYLYDDLTAEKWSRVIDTFCRTLNIAGDRDTVHIHLVSRGGSVLLLGRILSAISATKAKVITYAEGEVASAATSIWGAGHERHIYPGAHFMQHMSSQLLEGKTSDIVVKSNFCMEYIKRHLDYLGSINLFSAEEIEAMVDKSEDVYVSGREAIERVGSVSYRQ